MNLSFKNTSTFCSKFVLTLCLSTQLALSVNPLIMTSEDEEGAGPVDGAPVALRHLEGTVAPFCPDFSRMVHAVKSAHQVELGEAAHNFGEELWTENNATVMAALENDGFAPVGDIRVTTDYGHEEALFGMIFRNEDAHTTVVAFRGAGPLGGADVADWCALAVTDHVDIGGDIRGHHGVSDISDAIKEQVAEQLRAIFEGFTSLDDERLIFLGHSMGGGISLDLLLKIAPELGPELFGDNWKKENRFNYIALSTPSFLASGSIKSAEGILGKKNMLTISVKGDKKLVHVGSLDIGVAVKLTKAEIMEHLGVKKVNAHEALAGLRGMATRCLSEDLVNAGLNHEETEEVASNCSIM